MAAILNSRPDELTITTEFICKLHRDAFRELFPEWAGSYRDRDVTVGKHTPPHYFEVPVLMRQYCDNLESRLSPIGQKPPVNNILFETLAFAEGCFLSIHPFYDFNGRVARMLLLRFFTGLTFLLCSLCLMKKTKKERKNILKPLPVQML